MSNTKTSSTNTQPTIIRQVDLAVKVLIRISLVLGSVAALGMVINVFLDVVLRFGFNSPIQGTNQFVSYWWMLPLVFSGLAAAQYYDEHTDLPIIFERLAPNGQIIMTVFSLTCTGIFVALIGWFGLENAIDQALVGEYDSSTGVTVWPPRFVVPIACLAFVFIIIAEILKALMSKGTGTENTSTADLIEESSVDSDMSRPTDTGSLLNDNERIMSK